MKLSRVIIVVVFLGIFAMATHVSIDSDTWWHLRAGQWMVDHREMIQEDVFSYTSAGKPWQYPGLWIQVVMFKIFDWFGPGGLNLWVSLTVTVIFGFVWKTMDGNELLRAAIVLLAVMSSAIYWAARPYLVSYLLFAVYYLLLEKYYREERGKIWLLPLLMVVWVNSHGGFLAGFILWGPYLIDLFLKWVIAIRQKSLEKVALLKKRWVYLVWIGISMLAASLVNPQGIKLWELPFSTVSRQAEQLFIAEWQSPDFHNSTLLPFGLLLILSLLILGGSQKRLNLYELLLMAGFGLLGLISVRNIFFFVIIAPAILSRVGGELISKLGKDLNIQVRLDFSKQPNRIGSVINIILVTVVGLVSILRVVSFLPKTINDDELRSQFPIAAVEFLQTKKLRGEMFNSYNFGGYLIWASPEYPVFVDGRADLHQDEIILLWYRVINGSDEWKDVFDEWDIQFVLVDPGVPLLTDLKDAGWVKIYEDDLSVIAVSPINEKTLD